jgi:hypothetical protein
MIEALKLALVIEEFDKNDESLPMELLKPIAATLRAIAELESQEPVAWVNPSWIDPDTRGWASDSFESIPIEGWLSLYTHPPQRTEQGDKHD